MTVTANPTFSEWVSKTSESLDRAMSTANLSRTEAGITYVRFTRGEDGRPQNISTMKAGPSQPNLDRVGRTVVRRIGTLPPMFRGARQNLTIEAAIIVARDADELHQLKGEVSMRAERQNARWAARNLPNPVVALGVASGF